MALGDALRSLRESSGLDLVAVVAADGLLVDSAHAPDIDADSISAVAASGLLMMDALGHELGQGAAKQAILEYDGSLVVLTPLAEDLLLVAVSRSDANLGRLRLAIRRSVAEIAGELATI